MVKNTAALATQYKTNTFTVFVGLLHQPNLHFCKISRAIVPQLSDKII
jgi:hypothetical protein